MTIVGGGCRIRKGFFFSVNSTYKLLMKDLHWDDEVEVGFVGVIDNIWESSAPSKVIAFS
jgi:hypothetical protein